MCTRQIWINNHNEVQNYTSVFFLPWTSASQQKISRTEGAAGREKATPVPFSHTLSIQGFPAYKHSASLYSDKVVWIHFKQAAN